MRLNPKYKKIKQMPYCCVPACISMILDRNKIKHEPQEDIGCELGLVVPKNKKHLFKKSRTGKKPIAGYGTQVGKSKYSINNYFKNNKMPLEETYYSPKSVKNIKLFIENNIKKGNDMVICFNNKTLFGSGDFGHVCLVQEIKDNLVTFVNPEDNKVENKVELYRLVEAMSKHGEERRGGFWLISKRNSKL